MERLDATPERSWRRWGGRLASIGVRLGDDAGIVVQKQIVTLAAASVTVLSTGWVLAYLALGVPQAAAIPLAYQVISLVSLIAFARTGRFGAFATSQLWLMLLLPFLLQLTLGGFENGSVVCLWSLMTVFGAVYVLGPRRAIPWFLAFLVLVVVSGAVDPLVAAGAPAIPPAVRVAFFVLNVGAVASTTYLLLQHFVRQRDAAMAASERLLLNVLPRPIAERLKRETGVIAQAHDDVTVLFADVVDFTPFVARSSPDRLIALLERLFSGFDRLAERHRVEKIKTVGDAYMAAGGAPNELPDHTSAVAELALDMLDEANVCTREGWPVRLRIGIDRGAVVAGVIGRHRFIYDLWGDPVNTAARMESTGVPDRIQVTEAVVQALRDRYDFEARPPIEVKGKGTMATWFLIGRRDGAARAVAAADAPVPLVQSGPLGASSDSAASSGRTSTARSDPA
jgi:adenylate cyclase